jgi:hypothetical protein
MNNILSSICLYKKYLIHIIMPDIARNIFCVLLLMHSASSFVFGNRHTVPSLRHVIQPQLSLYMNKHDNTSLAINTSKIITMHNDYDELFEPRYIFGLSDYHLILLRLYIFSVITMNCLTIYANK